MKVNCEVRLIRTLPIQVEIEVECFYLAPKNMPLYEYRCQRCNKLIELYRAMDNHPLCCPECFEPKSLELIPSKSTFFLKGTGWYQTDYPKNKK